MVNENEQILALLKQAKEKIEKAEELIGKPKEEDDPFFKVLKAVKKAGGVVTKEEWIAIGKKAGYKPSGLGGLFVGKKPPMVMIAGDKRAITDKGLEYIEGEEE